jgi:hypothetical protein
MRPSGLCPTSRKDATFGRGARAIHLDPRCLGVFVRGRAAGPSWIGDGRAERSGRCARTASALYAGRWPASRARCRRDLRDRLNSQAVRPGLSVERCDRAIPRPDRSSAPCATRRIRPRPCRQYDRCAPGPRRRAALVCVRAIRAGGTPPATCNSSPAGNASISSSWTGCGSGSPQIVNRFPATTTNGRPIPPPGPRPVDRRGSDPVPRP